MEDVINKAIYAMEVSLRKDGVDLDIVTGKQIGRAHV